MKWAVERCYCLLLASVVPISLTLSMFFCHADDANSFECCYSNARQSAKEVKCTIRN
jgi:hypothetical protein